jgi:hypothetical protein
MTVVRDSSCYWVPDRPRCSCCGKTARYPFVHWMCERDLVLCADCCCSIQRGLTADMMRCAAIQRGTKELFSLHEATQ